MSAREIGRETSYNLVEIRTVLSRAETALKDLAEFRTEGHWAYATRQVAGEFDFECSRNPDCPRNGEDGYHETDRYPDPDYAEAKAALEALVAALGKFRRTGRPRKARRD